MYDALNKKLYELECALNKQINTPPDCDCEFQTIAEIITAMEALAGDARLDASAIKNLDGDGEPSPGSVVDLSLTRTGTTFTIVNTGGDNALVLAASDTEAGALTAAKFNEITANTAKISADGSIDTHSDVDTVTSAPTNGQVLKYNGTNWVPATEGAAITPTELTLTSGVAMFSMSYIGASAPTLTASNGVYTIVLPLGTKLSWLNAYTNNTSGALTPSQEFVVKVDNAANTFNRRFSVQYMGANGALFNPFEQSMNYTQPVINYVTTITIPNATALGSAGFWIVLN